MKKLAFIALSLSLLCTGFANAQEENSNEFKRWQVRLRGVAVTPDESASIGIIGGDASISSTFIPELDFTYFFTKNIAAELILGTSKHDVHTTGSDISAIGGPTHTDVDLGSVYLLPPTLTLQYHFMPDSDFRPYAGAGINYTIFYGVDEGNTIKDVEYDNAFGFALQAGLDYAINDKFFVNVDVKKIFLKTDVTVDASNLADGLSIPAEVDINPWLFGFGVGMKF
ncbi:outer membrane beta-barrel protein [Flavobacterium sp. MFBS3-15]|uniref:OmpW/AlkL family protein n=1 Tax=Flavobacterium sp. MFBS3-15 TaxID=2989816 RepID=UPI00223609A0|nr:OmpW family outer membrane protein [Flavobacterium sp. MFBS3-15]MCW4470890.1 outer membrane beta-barrel protein [Flavobacterium sp. MFBS3-15]